MKKKKTSKKKKADRISKLPDHVLCHILSFLPTNAAVATSVLSKRWNPLWRSVSSLEFSDQDKNDDQETYLDFVQFVYAVLLSRNWDQPIQSFSLSCYSSYSDYYHVNVWVNAALQRRVQHLFLSLPAEMGFPTAILNCKTLVVLKLSDSVFGPSSFEPFFSVDLPSLKTLHMNSVNFVEDKHFPELLCGAPNLEDFEAIYFHLIHAYPIEAKFRRMSKLIRSRVTKRHIPLNVVSNAQFLCIFWVTNEEGRVRNPYYKGLIPHFHNLIDLKVEDARLRSNEHWLELLEMLRRCPKLQILDIDIKQNRALSVEEDAGSDWSYPASIPSCISSHLKTCRLNGYGGSRGEFRFVTYVMQSALHLQAVAISCAEDVDQGKRLEMLKELSLCPRLSTSCVLSFE